jgi:hypothetical protein
MFPEFTVIEATSAQNAVKASLLTGVCNKPIDQYRIIAALASRSHHTRDRLTMG